MMTELKATVIPVLRKAGFRGSFPHFRRLHTDAVDLVTFQFDRRGGGFLVEIAKASMCDFMTPWDKIIEPNKLTAHDLHPDSRFRLGDRASPSYPFFRYDAGPNAHERAAQDFIDNFRMQAEPWLVNAVPRTSSDIRT